MLIYQYQFHLKYKTHNLINFGEHATNGKRFLAGIDVKNQ